MTIICEGCGTIYDTDKWTACRQCKAPPPEKPRQPLPNNQVWWRKKYGGHHSNLMSTAGSNGKDDRT